MRSPFSGMDPYLERYWRDVHADLIASARTGLNRLLPEDLIARMEERVVIDDARYDRARAIYPDVRVYEDPSHSVPATATATSSATIDMAEPIILALESEEHTEPYITLLDRDGGELVTVIEVLSPSNKLPGDSREQYRRKRRELTDAHVNFVEIDLIREGSWRDLLLPYIAPERAETTYRVVNRRAWPKLQVELFAIDLRRRLPAIPVPLRQTDADVHLKLQDLVDQVYANGRYDRTDYSRPCEPPLTGDDAVWAQERINATRSD